MKKAITIMVLLAVAAFASDPRLTVLGGDARLLTNDYLEMWAYPGNIGDYQFVTGSSETVSENDGWFGIVDSFNGNTYGVALNHNGYDHEVLFGNGSWGAIFSMNYDKYAQQDTTFKNTSVGAAWGTDVSLFADYSDLAFTVGYDKISAEYNEMEPATSDLTMGASLRGHSNGFFNLFPVISADMDMETADPTDELSLQTTTISFDFGAGRNKKVADNTNLVLGVFAGFQNRSFGGDYEDEDAQMWIKVPTITGGVEQEIGKWLVFRAGAESVTRYYAKGDDNSFTNDFNTNFGIGMHWDNFTMDATISEGFLHDGPYMIGGSDNGFMGSLAATYNF